MLLKILYTLPLLPFLCLYSMEAPPKEDKNYNDFVILCQALEKGNKELIAQLTFQLNINSPATFLLNEPLLHWILFRAELAWIPEGLRQDYRYELVTCLLIWGADKDIQDAYGMAALHKAAMGGDKRLVMFLVAHDVYINCRSLSGWTPLSYAIAQGHVPIVSYLLECTSALITLGNNVWEGDYKLAVDHLEREVKFLSVLKNVEQGQIARLKERVLQRAEIVKILKTHLCSVKGRYALLRRKCFLCHRRFYKSDMLLICDYQGYFAHGRCIKGYKEKR